MLTKLSVTQLNVINVLLDGYHLFQTGTKSGNLIKIESEIDNPHPNICTVGTKTISALKKSKMIELKRRHRWDKWYGPTEKAQKLFLSLYNTNNCQRKPLYTDQLN
jgi:hypothetical protein